MTVGSSAPLIVRRDSDILSITLARPRVRNAIDTGMLTGLEAAISQAAADPALRLVVLHGEGGYFCAGGDLKERKTIAAEGGDDALCERNLREGRLLAAVARLPQLVVAAVEGGAVGAGLGMLCVSDIVIARDASMFGAPEVADGAIPAQISPLLVARIGVGHARRLLLTSARFDAAEAFRIGLVHEVVAGEAELTQAVERLVSSTRRCGRLAIAATKMLLARIVPADADYPRWAATVYHSVLKQSAADHD